MKIRCIVVALAIASNPLLAESRAPDQAAFDQAVRESLLRQPELLIELFGILEDQEQGRERLKDLDLITSMQDRLFGGMAADKKHLVEFVDYNCGYCRHAQGEVTALLAADPMIVLRVVHLPILGEDSVAAAKVMLAVETLYDAPTVSRVHEALLAAPPPVMKDLAGFIRSQGLDADAVMTLSRGPEVQGQIDANVALARDLGISGTPGFVTRAAIIRGFADQVALAKAVQGDGNN